MPTGVSAVSTSQKRTMPSDEPVRTPSCVQATERKMASSFRKMRRHSYDSRLHILKKEMIEGVRFPI